MRMIIIYKVWGGQEPHRGHRGYI